MSLGRLNVATVWALVILGSQFSRASEWIAEFECQESECLNLTPLMSFFHSSFCKCGSGARLRRVLQGMRLQAKLGLNLDGKGSLTRASVLSLQYILFAACVSVGWTCCFLWNWNKFLNARIPKLGDLVNHGKQSWMRVGGSGSKRFQGLFRRRHTAWVALMLKLLEANRSMVESLMEGQQWPLKESPTADFSKAISEVYQRLMIFPCGPPRHLLHVLQSTSCSLA